MPQIAFIGLGRMGHGMAGRYLECGFRVAVWNRSKAKAEDLIARGARWANVAAMNSSRSPSSTPEVSEVCTPVRRSFTIW